MRHKIGPLMATTGMTLVTLALIGSLSGAAWISIGSVYQCLGANLMVHLGLSLMRHIECKHILSEALLDIGYVSAVLIVFGAVFGWYSSTPIWVLILMAVLIYLAAVSVRAIKVGQEIRDINEMLKARDEAGRE